MKRILKLLLPFLMAFALCLPVLAEEQRVFDNAGLLDEWEVSMLEDKIQDLRDTYDMDVVLLTLNSLDGKTAEGYADDYYDENGFGENGMLFLLDMDTRSWYMLTHGTAIYAVTDYGIQEIFSAIASDLSGGNYYDAFDGYLDELYTYFQAYADGKPIDGYRDDYTGPGSYEPGTRDDVVYYPDYEPSYDSGYVFYPAQIGVSLLVGAIIGLIALLIARRGMNTVKSKGSATDYVRQNTFRITGRQDIFLYSNVTKTRRDTDSGSSAGHSGGGSSVHTSSSGHSHGGGGGHF